MTADLNEVLVFAKVVEAGSFSAAARQLEMPKSTVSRKVSDLEERVGARLLQRTTRKLGLTDAGRIYYQHSARVVAELEAAGQAVSQMQAAPRGLLRVSAPVSVATLGPVIAAYLRRHPEVQVELACTDRRVDLVEEGYDLAIRAGVLADSSLVARPLGAMRRILAASPGFLRRSGTPRAPRELAGAACVAFRAGPSPNLWVLGTGDQAPVEVRVAPRLAVNDLEIMLEATRAGVGIAYLPDYVAAADIAAGRLRRVLPAWSSPEVPLHAIYPTARQLSPKVTSFIDFLRARFRFAGDPLVSR